MLQQMLWNVPISYTELLNFLPTDQTEMCTLKLLYMESGLHNYYDIHGYWPIAIDIDSITIVIDDN
jgi:hypothetical protein